MSCFLAFTDACPQESINVQGVKTWHTMAAVGMILEGNPFANGLLVPGVLGDKKLIRIPDPQKLAESLQPDTRAAFRSWKDIRTTKRKRKALWRLLAACQAGKCLFLSHSTLSHLAAGVATNYLGRFCSGFVRKSLLIGQPGYIVSLPSTGVEVYLNEQRMISLVWVVHSLSIFLHKARESFGNMDGLFVHDNLPFNNEEDIAIVQLLLNAQDPGRIHFMTERDQFEFAPSDNLAAATNGFISGTDHTIQTWIWKEGRPRNFYMTADEENGTFTRFI